MAHSLTASHRVNGFIVGDLESKYGSEFYKTIPRDLASGDLKFSEVKYDGLDKAPQAFIDLLAGKQGGGDGLGKVVLQIE
jgi:NADPH-dependent curcumin reductase CurA